MQGNQYTGYGVPYGGMNSQQTGFMQNQQTGYPGMQQGGMGMNNSNMGMRSQPTGMPSGMGRMQSQQTGMPSMGMQGMNTGGMQPMMTGMPKRPQQTGMSSFSGMNTGSGFSSSGMGMSSNPTGASGGQGNYSFLNAPPPQSSLGGGMGSRMTPQMTGYPGGGMGAMTAQPTGMPHDPRLQMMAASFMPSNVNQPFSPTGNMQFAHPLSQPLQQSFQSLLSNPSVATPKVPWTLSRQEKKDYDQIFCAWTGGEGGGFIDGEMAREVFGQAGLGREDLMKIWNLADINNRGKLNLPEFHVAMGLIYRALNGNQIPDTLPAELIPPSMRDIDSTVDFVKDLLRNDNSSRNTPDINLPGSYASRNNNNKDRDATNYKHDDTRTSGYKSSARHLDRRQVRYEGEDPSSELDSLKRDLEKSSAVLDRTADDFAKRTEEDEQLEQELDDLKYRVRRVKDDIEYVSRGKRTPEKDEERRKLERELMYLLHERLPEVEKKIEDREERKRQEVREGIRARDKRNETYGRYDRYDGARRSSFDRDRERYRDEDRGHSRYDERERGGRDSRDRSRDRYDSYSSRRPLSPLPRDRTPPPVPAEQPKSTIRVPPPAPPAPTSVKTSAPATKNMSPEERAAFIRAQAQERLQARMRALGMAVPESEPSTPTVDKSVEERLEREKKEAEEKTKQAEKEQEEREAARKARLQQATGGGSATLTPSANGTKAPPAPVKSAMKKAPAPPPPKPRAVPAAVASPKPAASPVRSPAPKSTAEDEELRKQEEEHKRVMEERRARIQRMREEEEEAQRAEEEMLKRRQQAAASRKVDSPPPVAPVALAEAAPVPQRFAQEASKSPQPSNASTNPFHRLQNGGAAAASPPKNAPSAGFNPFFRLPPQATSTPKAEESAPPQEDTPPPPPPPPPAPPAPVQAPVATRAPTRPPPAEEEWDVINEKDNDGDDSSDDDDYAGSRSMRDNLARALFGGGGSKPASPVPTVNKASLAKLGGGDPGSRGALFASIQGGVPRLRHTTTVDKSAPPVSGRVIGDAAPPSHISDAPREHAAPQASPPQAPREEEDNSATQRSANRQSVDWYAGLAADADRSVAEPSGMASVVEAEEPVEDSKAHGTAHPAKSAEDDETSEFDMTTTLRVRSLYPYEGQRDVDLSFKENMILMAHPAKDPESPWWYGMLLQGGKSGWFPNSYVQEIKVQQAKALFPYAGSTDEELPFAEGDILSIVDSGGADWWKAEKNGVIFIVPAAYLELNGVLNSTEPKSSLVDADTSVKSATDVKSTSDSDPAGTLDTGLDNSSDSASDTSEDSVLSFDDDDIPEEAMVGGPERDAERERREQERLRIIESAGLHLKKEEPIPHARPKRRPPPAAPVNKRASIASTSAQSTSSLAVPQTRPKHDRNFSRDSMTSLGPDAYDRYEAYLEKAKNIPVGRTRSHSDARPASGAIDKAGSLQIGSPSSSTFTLGSFTKESKLAGFMSKLSTPATPERRTTTAISGPISIVRVDDGQEDAPSHGMGPTWSSLVDAELLANIDDKERKRQEAMFEFIVTENAYVRDLQLVVEVFYAPLMSMLEESVTSAIFGNLEDILLFNISLLSSLEDRQKACRLYIDRISDILSVQLPNVVVYKEYCLNQGQAISRLQTLREQDATVAQHLQTIRNENASVRNLDLSSFLLEPMQRLTRYPLLIRQIMKYGEEPEEIVQLDAALMSTERVLGEVNESVRQAENLERLRVLSEDLWIGGEGRLDLTQNTAYMGPRRLLKEGTVFKAKSGRKLQLVLCNDIIVLLDARNLYRMPIPLHEARAKEGSSRDGTAFTITQDYKRHGDTIALKTNSAKDAQAWIHLINGARSSAITSREEWAKQHRRRDGIGY